MSWYISLCANPLAQSPGQVKLDSTDKNNISSEGVHRHYNKYTSFSPACLKAKYRKIVYLFKQVLS
jgi:hypothetical protein